MDPANSTLGKILLDEITPVVMVLRTPLVEESSQKNQLSFIQLLSPFCNFNNIDVPVRTASDQPYRLKKFKLRLFYASDIRQPNIEVAKERLNQVITDAGEKDLSKLCSEPFQIETVLNSSQNEFLPLWFQYFNKELVRTVSFSEHEAFDHPVTCLLAVSSRDEDPINKFVDLFNTNQLPSLLNDGAMDPQILKHFVLVHDDEEIPLERATKTLAEMRSTFGANCCHLLCINSSKDGSGEHENLWAAYKTDISDGQPLRSFLSSDDVDELKKFIQDLSSKHIIPHMEQKIRLLNQQVSATRKGFRNQIKNLWWRKGKDDAPENPAGPMYTFSSIESQIRVLGDYAFMLHDYELALSNYRLLSTDYKLDKAWKHYAGVQEMMGLTYFMLDQSRKDGEYCMENAFTTYLKIGLSGQRNATRCGLWWVEMLKARDQYKEAASVYFRISGEEPLHSAVMLEQASYCYLFSTPPMLRKYGFHLVLSGDLYKKCDQIKHAIRTYKGALSVFKGTTWRHIRDHVHFHLGKWYGFLGIFDVAIKNMMEVLACGHQSKTTQELFLKDFLQIIQQTGKTYEVPKLQLPIINIPSVKVMYEDHRTYASQAAIHVKESLWRSLEEDMIPTLSSKSNWLELQSKILPKKFKESNICVAGEAIGIAIEFKNPLQIPVSISGVSLICEHSPAVSEPNANNSTGDQNGETSNKSATSGNFTSDTSSFTLSEADVALGESETVLVQLTVTPRAEGTLKIVGIRWKLSGSLAGFCTFDSDLVRKKVVKGNRKSKRSPIDNLKFLVIKSLPKLEGIIHPLPETVYVGDLRCIALELQNPSKIPVKKLKMKVSPPRFLQIGRKEDLEAQFPACLERKSSRQSSLRSKTDIVSDDIFLFPEDTTVVDGAPISCPLWLRAAAPGKLSLYLSVFYEMGDTSSVMTYRTLRLHFNIEVLPSLDVSFQISPRPSRLREFLVRMDVINRSSSKGFQVHQLSSIGNEWEISLLEPTKVLPSDFLRAGQAISWFLKLKNCRSVTDQDSASSLCPPEKADVNLLSGSEMLFDIYSSPLSEFHHYERVHQRISDQEHEDTVDFILVSRSQSEQNKCANVFSHHICHRSVRTSNPIWWIMDGPQTIKHDFKDTFCAIPLRMIVHNSSDDVLSIRCKPSDSAVNMSSSGNASASSRNEVGWHDLSLSNDIKVTSNIPGTRVVKPLSSDTVPAFIWSASSSTHFTLEPLSSRETPLEISVFSPGTFDLSNYTLHWSRSSQSDHGDESRASSGTCQGHPFYITVLQQD
ncbi:trafficking protein particle complex subunit 8 [Capsicum galapagoense]